MNLAPSLSRTVFFFLKNLLLRTYTLYFFGFILVENVLVVENLAVQFDYIAFQLKAS